ncbi:MULTISPECIES: MBL fold metallo-hydrolase [Rhodococcus]|uniref:MBL fold metallo-hydrolase n=1 Tax=Rhodococcus oxybenzonivorans TaxID=1990687 RepID=A0AAE5AA84_9NOCA|nr:MULTISPECIES: MBL fold metallo-hydrolase [Rhodococcus]MDV7241957.1 MBL fold metallo-hydrolase [Rhodococcus oxybenzonivorans]MDV7268913.1 MBL fold metallo-hydrolase [Rhodococcus oxybenzonivorans]MDV7277779.1 MBL fold metallo-hydrolase [Rhodococcus oxybenzonivorans]MDV7334239.1 MBL fold metallo-hydrolase [Rhodococcus oxybenzonivorans]MDV7343658.1 MBL fold metallo-hydrolase [Rhodococcus oxybenzonivorans]
MPSPTVVEVEQNVFCATGTDVNWVLLREGTDLTLIDAGYPADIPAVEESIRSIGRRPEDVRAILLTHAHIDHIGAINHFRDKYGTPVYMSAVETSHAKREYLEQAGEMDVVKNIWRPGMLRWSLRIARAGATRHVTVPHAAEFPAAGPLDLPGTPLPVATTGHTSGHTSYYLPSVGAVVTGDCLVTGHPTSRTVGPQLLLPMFHHSEEEVLASLDALATLDADLLIPGHGRTQRTPIRDAVATVRERAAGKNGSAHT